MWRHVLDVNVHGMVACAKYAVPEMVRVGGFVLTRFHIRNRTKSGHVLRGNGEANAIRALFIQPARSAWRAAGVAHTLLFLASSKFRR